MKFIRNYSVFMPSRVGLEHLLSHHPLASSVSSHATLSVPMLHCHLCGLSGTLSNALPPLLYTLYPSHWEHSLALVTFYLVGVLDQAAPRPEILLSHL